MQKMTAETSTKYLKVLCDILFIKSELKSLFVEGLAYFMLRGKAAMQVMNEVENCVDVLGANTHFLWVFHKQIFVLYL